MVKSLMINNDRYKHLVDEIRATITESVFTSRWALVEGYWNIGKLIRNEFSDTGITDLLHDLAVDVGVSERTLWYAVQAFDRWPDINKLPEGKNISWNKICNKYLPAKSEVGQSQENPNLSSLPASGPRDLAKQIPGLSDLLKYGSYQEYVEAQPCILCGKSPVDKAHFPKTKGAGASDDFIIPACRECHSTYHLNPLKWMHDYQGKWAAYYYGLILRIWGQNDR